MPGVVLGLIAALALVVPTLLWLQGWLDAPRKHSGGEALPIIDECLKRATGKVVHPQLVPLVTDLRLRHFQKARDAAGCRATAEMWEQLNRTDAASLWALESAAFGA